MMPCVWPVLGSYTCVAKQLESGGGLTKWNLLGCHGFVTAAVLRRNDQFLVEFHLVDVEVTIELLVRAERELPFLRMQVKRSVKVVMGAAASALRADLVLDVEESSSILLGLRANLHVIGGVPVVEIVLETDPLAR